MKYTISIKSKLRNLILLTLGMVVLLSLLVFLKENQRLFLTAFLVFIIYFSPQVYLALQYEAHTPYKSFEIDYDNELIYVCLKKGDVIKKPFAELKILEYHKAHISNWKLSPALKIVEYLFYYRFAFKDGTNYYLTSLASPTPFIKPDGKFYPYYNEVSRKLSTIKKEN